MTDGNYALLLIPIGAIFYLAISRLSDIGMANRGIRIDVGEELGEGDLLKMDNGLFQQAFEHARQSNDAMLAVRGMAVRLGEFTKILGSESGKALQESEVYKVIGSSASALYRDLICISDMPYREANARIHYEKRLNEGSLRMKKRMGVDEFLERGRMICYNDLGLGLLQSYVKKGYVEISALDDVESRALKDSGRSYCRGNALLLFLELNKRIGVVEC